MKKTTHKMNDPMIARARRPNDIGATFSGRMSREDVLAKCLALQASARIAQGLPAEVESHSCASVAG